MKELMKELKYEDLLCNKCSYGKRFNPSGKINFDVPPCEDRDCFLRQFIITLSKSENFELEEIKPTLDEIVDHYIFINTLVDISPRLHGNDSILNLFDLAINRGRNLEDSSYFLHFLLYVYLPREVYKDEELKNRINELFCKIKTEEIDDVSKLYLAMRIGNYLEEGNLIKLLKSINCGYLRRAAESYTWKNLEGKRLSLKVVETF